MIYKVTVQSLGPEFRGDLVHESDYLALEARCREQLKALHQVRDFEPVVNGEYAVMEAIPAMRKIAIEAIAASASETGTDQSTKGEST